MFRRTETIEEFIGRGGSITKEATDAKPKRTCNRCKEQKDCIKINFDKEDAADGLLARSCYVDLSGDMWADGCCPDCIANKFQKASKKRWGTLEA